MVEIAVVTVARVVVTTAASVVLTVVLTGSAMMELDEMKVAESSVVVVSAGILAFNFFSLRLMVIIELLRETGLSKETMAFCVVLREVVVTGTAVEVL